MTQSDKTSLIARKYTHAYNGIYLLFCVCYSNSVSFIGFLRSVCIHGEACAKISCSEKELLNLKDSKLTQNFYGNKTGFVRPGHIYVMYICIKAQIFGLIFILPTLKIHKRSIVHDY